MHLPPVPFILGPLFLTDSTSATGFSGLGPDIDKRFFLHRVPDCPKYLGKMRIFSGSGRWRHRHIRPLIPQTTPKPFLSSFLALFCNPQNKSIYLGHFKFSRYRENTFENWDYVIITWLVNSEKIFIFSRYWRQSEIPFVNTWSQSRETCGRNCSFKKRYIYKDRTHLMKLNLATIVTRKNVKSRHCHYDATDNSNSQKSWIDSFISTIGRMGWFITKKNQTVASRMCWTVCCCQCMCDCKCC